MIMTRIEIEENAPQEKPKMNRAQQAIHNLRLRHTNNFDKDLKDSTYECVPVQQRLIDIRGDLLKWVAPTLS